MQPSESEASALCDSLAATIGKDAGADFDVELKCLMNRYLRDHYQRQRDAEVAKLLPSGWRAVAERFGYSKSGTYKKNKRHRERNAVHGNLPA